MPGIWMKDFGFECSEPLVVTEKGCELFLNLRKELFSNRETVVIRKEKQDRRDGNGPRSL